MVKFCWHCYDDGQDMPHTLLGPGQRTVLLLASEDLRPLEIIHAVALLKKKKKQQQQPQKKV